MRDYFWWVQKEWLRYMFGSKDPDSTWANTLYCRWCGHPGGVYWYSSGHEPDMHCKNCGDNLG